MKKILTGLLLVGTLFTTTACSTSKPSTFNPLDLIGGGGNTNTPSITDVVSGVINELTTTSNLNVSDLAGKWTITGSAIAFESQNLLSKAGGAAAEQMITGKIDPYLKKFKLTGGTLTIQANGEFTLQANNVGLSGTVTKNNGKFNFNFSALGNIKLGTITAYVEKSASGLSIMFDTTKIKDILSALSGVSSQISSITSILNSYEGIYMGFKFQKTGNVAVPSNTNNSKDALPSVDDLKGLFKH